MARQISEEEYLKIRQLLSPKVQLACDIAWFTGERMGAIVQLLKSDCYTDNQTIKDYIFFRKETRKGKDRNRSVAINPQLKKILKTYKVHPNSIWLIPGRNPENHISFDTVDDGLRKATGRLGINNVSSHSYRRSLVNRLARKGYSIKLIQRAVGHVSIESTNRYLVATDDEIDKAFRNL